MTANQYLLLNRMVVSGYGRIVYDQSFRCGVNIIRGKNSSGKSTITDMIFFVLGGENIEWTDEAALCDAIFAEFNVSGRILSIKRRIDYGNSSTIGVCEGKLDDTMESHNGWSYFGRQRSGKKESFSQFMFDCLGLPQTKSEDSLANVTMYQILRLIYGDQNTDCTSIFRREKNPFADRQDIRRSIGEMLLGIDNLMGHELRQELIHLTKQLSYIKSRYTSLLEAAEKTDPNFSISNYSALIENAQEQQKNIEIKLDETASEPEEIIIDRKKEEDLTIRELEKLINIKNIEIAKKRISKDSLSLNIEDSEAFIASLESNLNDLLAANNARNIIGTVALSYCPICLADLSPTNNDQCPLCKSSTYGDSITGGRLRYEQELKHQINESKQLLQNKKASLIEFDNSLKKGIRTRNTMLSELKSLISPNVRIDSRVIKLLKEYGYLTRKIEDLGRLESLQSEVNSLEKEVVQTNIKLENIEKRIKCHHKNQEERREYCQKRISELTIKILHEDVVDNNNDTLNDADGFIYSFEKDFLSVRHGRLSASTQAFLKNSFYLSLLQFAIEDEQCRLPKFYILDNIEDKGMVPERFRKFHHLLIDYSNKIDTPHQVILTTSYIDEELNNSQYCIGPSYDHPPFTLDIKGEWDSGDDVFV